MNSRGREFHTKENQVSIEGPHACNLTEEEWQRHHERNRTDTMKQVGARIACKAAIIQTVLDSLAEDINTAMRANGFWDDEHSTTKLPAVVSLIHSELSELLEANRNKIEHDDKVPEFTGEEAEAADTLIRLLDAAGGFRWRLGEALVAKMLYNLSRPRKHGKQY